ncbi:hypothetical protein [Nocardioides sp. L-11A]|uniref:hypothetical protein n=1 Tax=Nocardioides sp. L-11A TaxID=3043848 RepID=UPI002499D9B0|nr:hypothetical protein QJ852_03585 [Nocardioides sp. L-11A]
MSTDHTLARPEVTAFVEEVRRHLADLDEETRDDLVGGLEADLADQLADGTPLADPAAYATELRAAAGLPERVRRRRRIDTSGWPRTPGELLDRSRDAFLDRATDPRIRPAWDLLVTLRPAWWVARAWVAVTLVDVAAGGWEAISLIPTLVVPGLGALLLLVAIVLSVLIGTGRLWPGSGPDRPIAKRAILLAANTAAVLIPLTWNLPWPSYLSYDQYGDDGYAQGWSDATRQGLLNHGEPVTDIFAYDAAGQPIPLVQLVDQDGRPLDIAPGAAVRWDDRSGEPIVACPARNGDAPVRNAFPFARLAPGSGGPCTPERALAAFAPSFPLATLPPVAPAWPAPAEPVTPVPTD